MAITDHCDDIQAYFTDYSRELFARATIGQIVWQAIGFTVGRGGFVRSPTLDPCHIQPVNTADTALQDQVYPTAGPVVVSADVAPFQEIDEPATTNVTYQGNTHNNGFVLDGLPSISDITIGSSVVGLNIQPDTVVTDILSPTSVQINLAATNDGTGINLTFVTSAPVVVYNCRLASTPIQSNADYALGELGVWGQIIQSNVPSEVGKVFLAAIAHFPMKGKTRRDVLLLRVVVDY
jgi:hypothetical protein